MGEVGVCDRVGGGGCENAGVPYRCGLTSAVASPPGGSFVSRAWPIRPGDKRTLDTNSQEMYILLFEGVCCWHFFYYLHFFFYLNIPTTISDEISWCAFQVNTEDTAKSPFAEGTPRNQ